MAEQEKAVGGTGKVDSSAELQKQTVRDNIEKGGRPGGDDNANPALDGVTLVKSDATAKVKTVDSHGNDDRWVEIASDVIAEFTPEGALRPSHVLLFHKGQRVLQSEIDRKVALYERTGADADGDGAIDSTTVASGTKVTEKAS